MRFTNVTNLSTNIENVCEILVSCVSKMFFYFYILHQIETVNNEHKVSSNFL